MSGNTIYRFILAGGGTGGHLYPAVAIAEQIKLLKPEAEILFVGTSNKIESRVIPQLGYKFRTIWISGFARKLNLQNLLFPIKMIVAVIQSVLINIKFKPKVAIGTGAYVAGPVMWGASFMGAKVVLLEQNSYPGITNRMLEKKAEEIHLTFDDSKKYFREQEKLVVSGNPIRVDLKITDKKEALAKFGLSPDKKTLLVLGGSGGAKSINDSIVDLIKTDKDLQILWQTGAYYYDSYKQYENENVKVLSFIDDMSSVYSACDLIVCRSGATTIAEVALLGLPVIFVPSTNVAADHQFKNAESIVKNGAAELLRDNELKEKLNNLVNNLLSDKKKLVELSEKIKKFSMPKAAENIAKSAIKMAENKVF